jgi:hypothetical protein
MHGLSRIVCGAVWMQSSITTVEPARKAREAAVRNEADLLMNTGADGL